jgi:stress response protein YsnF
MRSYLNREPHTREQTVPSQKPITLRKGIETALMQEQVNISKNPYVRE